VSLGFRRVLWPGLMTVVMLAILLSLGTWQMQRRDWKLALLAAIDAAEANPAVPMPANPAPFSKVVAEGTFVPQSPTARYGAEVRQGKMGAHVIATLHLTDGRAVLADLGWLADGSGTELPAGLVRIEGFIRPGETASWAAATDNLVQRRFYTLDPAKIGLALGQSTIPPYVLVTLGSGPVPGKPEPATKMPRPPNDHLSYALTWYGLAAVLAIVFLVYARKVLRP